MHISLYDLFYAYIQNIELEEALVENPWVDMETVSKMISWAGIMQRQFVECSTAFEDLKSGYQV